MKEPKIERAHCNECHTDTNHELLFEKTHNGTEEISEDFDIDWGVQWNVLQCRGCNSMTMKRVAWNSEFYDEKGPIDDTTFFPPRTFRERPKWLKDRTVARLLPACIDDLFDELYVTLQNDCRASAAMLIRAVFETVMISKVGDNKSFTANLDKFQHEGFITSKQRIVIEPMLEAGHATIHRSYMPKREDLVVLVDIIEGVMNLVYVQTPRAEKLAKEIPPKKK